MISRHHLAEVIGERTLHVRDSRQLAKEVAAYLLDARETADLESLLRDIMEYRASHGIVEAVAVSAHELNGEIIKEIKHILKQEYPKAKTVTVASKLDPSVVGGVRVELANRQLDLTVRDKIDMFKRLSAEIKE